MSTNALRKNGTRGIWVIPLTLFLLLFASIIPSFAVDNLTGDMKDNADGHNSPSSSGGSGTSQPGGSNGSGNGSSNGGGSNEINCYTGAGFENYSDPTSYCWVWKSYGLTYASAPDGAGFRSSIIDDTFDFDTTQYGTRERLMREGQAKCNSTESQKRKFAGYRISYKIMYNIYTHAYTKGSATIDCGNYQVKRVTLKCYTTVSAVAKQTAPSSKARTIASKKENIRGSGSNAYEACKDVTSARISLSAPMKELGRYRLDLKINYVNKTFDLYSKNIFSGKQPKPQLVETSGTITRSRTIYGQIACDPALSGAGSPKSKIWVPAGGWNQNDCYTTDSTREKHEYQCVFNGPRVAINGNSTRRATLFRDGELNSLVWARPSIKGNVASITSTSTRFTRTGTPWDTPKDLPHSKNDVRLFNGSKSMFNKDNGSGWRNGLIYDTDISATWASKTGEPTVIVPEYRFKGLFNIRTLTITGFNIQGDVWTSRRTTQVESTAYCTGSPATLNFVRSVDSK